MSITGNIDEHSVSTDVPEAVSEILVRDIKKDKRLFSFILLLIHYLISYLYIL